MSQRIKGQDVSVIVIQDDEVQDELTEIASFNIGLKLELLQKGYLGRTTDDYDEVFKGASFDFEMDNHSQDFLSLAQSIIDRARRKSPNIVFNIVCTLLFPNGQTPVITLPDVKFGEIPISIASRTENVKVKISGACGEPDIQKS